MGILVGRPKGGLLCFVLAASLLQRVANATGTDPNKPHSFVAATNEIWVNNVDEECLGVPDKSGLIKRCIADMQCAFVADKFSRTEAVVENNPRSCQKRKYREEGQKCVVFDHNCQEGLFCQPHHGKMGPDDLVGGKSGECKEILDEDAECKLEDGSHLGCPRGHGCNMVDGRTGKCTAFFTQGEGSLVSRKEFCLPWLFRQGSSCQPISRADCDKDTCSRDAVAGFMWSPLHNNFGEPVYRAYCDETNTCKMTGGEEEDCLSEYQTMRLEDPLWPIPACPPYGAITGGETCAHAFPLDITRAYDSEAHVDHIRAWEKFRKCMSGHPGFGEYIYPPTSLLWLWLLLSGIVVLLVSSSIGAGVFVRRKLVAKKRKEQYVGNFRHRGPSLSTKQGGKSGGGGGGGGGGKDLTDNLLDNEGPMTIQTSPAPSPQAVDLDEDI